MNMYEKNSRDKSEMNHPVMQIRKESMDNIYHTDSRYSIKNMGSHVLIYLTNKLQLLITINLCPFWV